MPQPTAQPTPPDAVRASDTERDAVVARLRDAVGEGRLTLAEAEERITAAYAAVHRAELAPLTADLPPLADPSRIAGPPDTPGRLGIADPARTPAAPHSRGRPPVVAVLATVAVVAWIASPSPFPWPLLLVAFLVLRHRARHRPT